jgi:drug/metabolite transporter (DMT)-like permease
MLRRPLIKHRMKFIAFGRHQHAHAVMLVLGSLVLFATETACTHQLAGRLPIAVLVLARVTVGCCLLAPLIVRVGVSMLKTESLRLHFVRGVFSASGLWFYYFMFSNIPLATASSLAYTNVMFQMFLSAFVLSERVSWQRWLAAVSGFGGVLLILRPGSELELAYAAPLVVAVLHASTIITTRMLAGRDSPETIMAYVVLIAGAVWVLPGLASWQTPTPSEWPFLLAIGICGSAAQYLFILAYRRGEASALAPFDYLRLVFNTTAGILIFNEVPDLWVSAGAVLILASAVVIPFLGNRLTISSPMMTRSSPGK